MYRHYLLGRKFIVRTDHHSLIWLLSFKCPQDQLARWLEELNQYHMVIQHRPGRRHCNTDTLSRLPVPPGACGTSWMSTLVICPVVAARSAKRFMTIGMLLLRK